MDIRSFVRHRIPHKAWVDEDGVMREISGEVICAVLRREEPDQIDFRRRHAGRPLGRGKTLF
jgi:hypothetical protein